jgi:hypothetical protein
VIYSVTHSNLSCGIGSVSCLILVFSSSKLTDLCLQIRPQNLSWGNLIWKVWCSGTSLNRDMRRCRNISRHFSCFCGGFLLEPNNTGLLVKAEEMLQNMTAPAAFLLSSSPKQRSEQNLYSPREILCSHGGEYEHCLLGCDTVLSRRKA